MSEVSDYWKPRVLELENSLSVTAAENAKLRLQLVRARELLKPFAMLAVIEAKDKDGLESVYPMVAAGRLHDARRFLAETDEQGSSK